ncbi:hypothetical protein [Hoylesella loescheii]|nr:hypothetical protein [Hoylesella loescheii]
MDFTPQKAKGYEVDDVIPTFVSFRLCIGYTNRYEVDGTTTPICT